MNCNYSKTYRSMYKAYTNETNQSGYAADVFEKNCQGDVYKFNTLNETFNNKLFMLGRPALISCKDGSKDGSKDDKIYCPSVDEYVAEYECPMYKACNCKNSKNCRKCIKTKCMKNHDCDVLCASRAGGLPVFGKQTACSRCKQLIKSF